MHNDNAKKHFGFKPVAKSDNPFEKMDAAAYRHALIICAELKSLAEQLAPLLDGKHIVIGPTGRLVVADLYNIEALQNARPAVLSTLN